MLPSTAERPCARYRLLFPDWLDSRPVSYFFAKELLEARAESQWPTNAAGGDEEVNVYLMDLLERSLRITANDTLRPGVDPLFFPPPKTAPHWSRAEYYRLNGDLRLLGLGLGGRGDLLARRSPPWGKTEVEARERDLHVGRTCYGLAGDALRRLGRSRSRLAPVLERLSAQFTEYVHVLEVLARGRLGLGARLSHAALRELLPPGSSS